MAATTFKQQCPSCEALVPIRDPKLIGRKIDCPKCKYRFVVEEPAEEADEAEAGGKKNGKAQQAVTARRPINAKGAMAKAGAARLDADDDSDEEIPAPKKKGGSSTTLILGIGLGAVALVLLAVVLIVVLSKGEEKPSTPNRTGTSASSSGNSETKEPEAPPAIQLADATNFLPNTTETVGAIRVGRLIVDSKVGPAAFRTPGAFNLDAFKSKFGFPLENVSQIVHAGSDTDNWVFNIVRLDTKKPAVNETVLANLNLKKADEKPQGLEYFLIGAELDSFGFLFLSGSQPRQLALHILDDYTLVVASELPMVNFLKDKRQPGLLSQPPLKIEPDKDPDQPGGKGGSAAPGGSGGQPNPNQGRGGSGGAGYPGAGGGLGPQQPSTSGGAPGGPDGSGSTNPQGKPAAPPAASASYLTINPSLKAMMDKLTLPEDPKHPALLCLATNPQVGDRILRKYVHLSAAEIAKLGMAEYLRDFQVVGACLKAFDVERMNCVIGADCKSESTARKLDADIRKELLPALAKQIKDSLDITVTFPGQTDPNTGTGAGQPGRPFTGFPPGGGAGGPPPGGAYGPMQPMPGGVGGNPGYGGSSRPPGGAGFPPNRGGSGGGGEMQEGTLGGGRGPAAGGAASGPKEETPLSSLGVSRSDNTVLLSANLIWSKKAPETVDPLVQEIVAHLKGVADMSSGGSRIHDLAAAVSAYAQRNQHFPRGTVERRPTAQRLLGFPPDQRLSWMVELLDDLGTGEYRGLRPAVDDQQSWRYRPPQDKKENKNNAVVAQTVIPYFLAAKSPESTWWVSYPGVDQPVAATHFVGIAGIGLDAAEYSAKDPSVTKKLGVFGYDRVTKLEDIKDGLDQTIVVIQVPTEVKSAWLAGGGSTIRGVPETDPVLPFVCTEFNGKPGTFAIMGDGKVRFIAKDINPETFKALCTINGGDVIDNLDEVAPLVPGQGKSLLKPQLPPVSGAPQPEAKPPTEEKKPAGGANAPLEEPKAPAKP